MTRPRPFRYAADPVCLAGAVAYVAYRAMLRPAGAGGAFCHGYLNDLLCLPLFLPISLGLQRRVGLRRHDGRPRLWEVVQHAAAFSVMFEIVIPRFPTVFCSTADPMDALAYLAGGLIAYGIWCGLPLRRQDCGPLVRSYP